ncbi:MAG: hypothetical protein JXL80_15405 [Planctomycetes bacterium]|nr:hypothetical protein [Planctomycetota bacterium]
MVRLIGHGMVAAAALLSATQTARAVGNQDVATLVEATPAKAFVAGWLLVILVALMLAVSFLKRSNR